MGFCAQTGLRQPEIDNHKGHHIGYVNTKKASLVSQEGDVRQKECRN